MIDTLVDNQNKSAMPEISVQTGHARLYELLSDSIDMAFQKLYEISVVGQLTRSQKDVTAGALRFIDYTFPCFEAAQVLHVSPVEIAAQLTREIQISLGNQGYASKFKLDAVGGYINIELSDEVMLAAVSSVAELYKNLPKLVAGKDLQLIIAGPSIGQGLNKDDAVSLAYLKQICTLAGYEVHICYMISDYSEDASEALAGLLSTDVSFVPQLPSTPKLGFSESSVKNLQLAQLHRRIKHAVASPESPTAEGSILEALRKIRNESLNSWEISLEKIGLKPDKLLLESELSAKVQQYLDASMETDVSNEAEGIVKDSNSQAAYYVSQDVVPLRTSGGFLYAAAYWLYLADTRMQSSQMLTTVIIVPEKVKALLKHSEETADKAMLYFNAAESSAIAKKLPSNSTDGLEVLLTGVSASLTAVTAETLQDASLRRDALFLIDCPTELNELLGATQLVDALNLLHKAKLVADQLA